MFNRKKTNFNVVHDQFFVQKNDYEKVVNRLELFKKYCAGKSVLHFGCTDYPIFNAERNLHIQLNSYIEELYGFDIDEAGIDVLKKHVNKNYFSSFAQVGNQHFDVCLIPETIEHVDNIQMFLSQISRLNCETFIITAPNCFAPIHIERNTMTEDTFEEIVHPDHNCWFSVYTLNNVIRKYTQLTPSKNYLLENETMVCVVCSKPRA